MKPVGMRPAWERELVGVRVNLSADPEAALDAADGLLRRARVNSERVRATLTRGWAHKAAGRPELLKEAIEEAARYRRPGNLAASELAGVSANYLILAENLKPALYHAEKSVAFAKLVATSVEEAPRGNWRSGKLVQSVVKRAAYSAALTVRADVYICLSNKTAPIRDAFEALKWADPRYVPHVHIAAVSLVSHSLLASGAATPQICAQVLHITAQADKLLDRRRVKARSRHRLTLRALKGVALALLGSGERAEEVLKRAIDDLESIGHKRDADLIAQQLVSILSSRAAQEGRALLLARKHGVTLPSAKKRRRDDDDDEPIGF